MATLSYGHIITNGAKIHYYRTGDEKPPVILLHGFSDNGFSWSRVALKLEPYFDLILVDQRGHGLSEATENGYSQKDRAADIAGLISALKIAKPVLIGHSYGAETAVLTAAHYPKMVNSLILEEPPFWESGIREPERKRSEIALEEKEKIKTYKEKTLMELMQISEEKHPNWHERDHFHWGKARQQVKAQISNGLSLEENTWREYCKGVKCPVLVVLGEQKSGSIVTVQTAQEIAAIWKKRVKIIQIAGVGHHIHREAMDTFHETIKSFLRKQTGW